jgi:hypothetical protein
VSIVTACLIVLLYAVVFAAFFKRSVCETLIPAVICPVFLLYLFGLLNFKGCLIVGMVSISILAIILITFTFKKHGFRSLIKKTELFTGTVVFAILVVAVFVMNFNQRLHIWDEFNHWGMRLKHIFTYNALQIYTEPGAWTLNPMCFYPPGTALLCYLFSYTGFSEWKALFSQQLFLLLLLAPFLKDIFKKEKLVLSIVFFSMLVLFFGAADAYATLYVDSLLGILFGFALVYYVLFARNNDSFGLFITVCMVAMLTLTKDVGFLLSMGLCIVMLFDGIVFTRKSDASLYISTARRLPALLVTLFSFMSWTIYLKVIEESLLKEVKLGGFFTLLSGNMLEDWQRVVRWNMVFKILPSRPIGGIFYGMSYMYVVFLFLVFGIIYSIVNGFKRNISWVTIITIGAGFYAFFLIYVFCFVSSPFEGSSYNSYERYCLSYLLSIPVIICTLIYRMQNKRKNVKTLSVFVILACFVFICSLSIVPYNASFPFITNRELFGPNPYEVVQKFIPALSDGELFQIMTPGDQGWQWQQVRYQLIAPNINTLNWTEGRFSVGEKPYFSEDPWTLIVNSEEWGDWLISNGFKKMLLWYPTPEFIKSYSTMFTRGIKPFTLYRIVQNNNSVSFEEISSLI